MIGMGPAITAGGYTYAADAVGLATSGMIMPTTGFDIYPLEVSLSGSLKGSLSVTHRSAGVSVSHRGAVLEVTE